MNEKELIIEKFNQNNISLTPDQATQFLEYFNYLTETNKLYNLTAITNFDEVVEKHFIDSCLNHSHFTQNATLCDIGSGAGFPAIPLKIIRPDIEVVMVDSLQKRINFLNQTIEKLNLKNIKAIHSRAQELGQIVGRECFDYVTARAVAPLNILLELCAPYCKVGGEIVALKSVNLDDELKAAQHAIQVLGLKLKSTDTFEIDANEKITRKIVYFSKIKSTPAQYPRPKNKVNVNPL